MKNAVVAGIGITGPFRHDAPVGNALELTADAIGAAARDAGISMANIDGLVVNAGTPTGTDYDQLATFCGLNVGTSFQTWAHGRFTSTVIYQAAMMVRADLARVVACVYSRRQPVNQVGGPGSAGWSQELRIGGGPHGEIPGIGLTAVVGMSAMAAQRYSHQYDVSVDELFGVVSAARENAAMYPGAFRTKLITREEYLANPFVAEPLRRWDCSPLTEGSVCVIVAADDAAANDARSIRILAFDGLPAGPTEFATENGDMGLAARPITSPPPDTKVFERADIARDDVGIFYTYDAFSPFVWLALERFGYCKRGEAAAFIADRGITYRDTFPINTHGGSLAAGQLAGWLQITEMITQLRGEAGDRQVRERPAIAHYGNVYGDSLILAR